MKCKANPVIVDAFVIDNITVTEDGDALIGPYRLLLDNGKFAIATHVMTSYRIPKMGDIYVTYKEGDSCIIPEEIFWKKFSALKKM